MCDIEFAAKVRKKYLVSKYSTALFVGVDGNKRKKGRFLPILLRVCASLGASDMLYILRGYRPPRGLIHLDILNPRRLEVEVTLDMEAPAAAQLLQL